MIVRVAAAPLIVPFNVNTSAAMVVPNVVLAAKVVAPFQADVPEPTNAPEPAPIPLNCRPSAGTITTLFRRNTAPLATITSMAAAPLASAEALLNVN